MNRKIPMLPCLSIAVFWSRLWLRSACGALIRDLPGQTPDWGTMLQRTRAILLFLVASLASATALAVTPPIMAGLNHNLALKTDGTVWAWGDNAYGQLGDGTTSTESAIPVQVAGLTGVTAIAAGGYHSLALKNDGTVWAWGYNFYGQLGAGTTTDSAIPVQVAGLTGVTAVAADDYHSLALKNDGTVWAWGNNAYGSLGDGTTTNSATPVQVAGLSGANAIAAGFYHSLALKNDGTVWTWGNNFYGQLGDGTTTNSATPVQVAGLAGATAVAAGDLHSLALKNDGTVWAWGINAYGPLGNGTTTNSATPVQVAGLTGATAVAADDYHSLALKNDGTVWAWGRNSFGELGDGTTTDSATPVQVAGLTGATAVSAGLDHNLALKNDGTVWAWGDNGYGQLGDGTTTNSATPVQSLINLGTTPVDVVLSLLTSQPYLDSLLAVEGNIALINVGGRDLLVIPNMTSVGLNVTVTGNNQLLVVDLGALQSTGGSIDISGNLAMTSLDLGALTTVGGNLTLSNDPSLSAIIISGVTTIGGNLTLIGSAATVISMPLLGTVSGSLDISGNQSAGAIDMGALTTVGGSLTIDNNTVANPIGMASLTTVSGSLDISGNPSAGAIDMGALTTVGGSLTIDNNTTANPINMASLTTVSGSLDISGNPSAGSLDLSTLTNVGGAINMGDNASAGVLDLSGLVSAGSLVITGNTSATAIDMGALTTIGGSLTIQNNGDAAINMGASTTVSGDLTIETTGSGAFDMGNGAVGGNLTLDTTGYTNVSGTTGGGATDLTNTTLDAVMHLQIQAATFTTPVSFTVTRLDPLALVPENGLMAGGGPAAIDPVAAYQFAFAIPGSPTLTPPATLSFDIDVAALDAAGQTAFLAALASNSITLAVKGDAPASQYQAFTVCDPATSLLPLADATGCVHVVRLDATGVPLPVDSLATPAFVRIQSIIVHFSTYAVVIVTPTDTIPPVLSGVPADFTVSSSVPLAVSWPAPTAIDAISGNLPVTCSPASGSIFQLGTTPVSCSATDTSGNTATAGFSVTVTAPVVDTTPPVISGMPANITVTSSVPLAVSWPAPTANDAVSGPVPVTCVPASGSIFPLGVTAVTCTASDAALNTATAGFSVTVTAPVVDTAPPVITGMPANITVTSSVPLAVTWPAPTANDAVSGPVPVTCTPASGSIFQLGMTAVTCTASDAALNTATAGFTVTVTAPPPPTTARKVIEPKLECVKVNGPGSYTARFGYNNANKVAVTIPAGPNNAFSPLPADRGQTTTFLPKRQKNTYTVDFDGNRITWTLKGPDGKTRSASATRKSDRCR